MATGLTTGKEGGMGAGQAGGGRQAGEGRPRDNRGGRWDGLKRFVSK